MVRSPLGELSWSWRGALFYSAKCTPRGTALDQLSTCQIGHGVLPGYLDVNVEGTGGLWRGKSGAQAKNMLG